ncbi:MAG: PEP-CTERM sorting domain-containing protein [Candidatus Hydrogenedentes bacterium]|nr:PEP-CTERM sorting domain-containing protein [Candidatus Hydrogenedentota bacterium]
MLKNTVTIRSGTAFIVVAAVGAFVAALVARADVSTGASANNAFGDVGAYQPSDGAALQGVLDAPGRSPDASESFEAAPDFREDEVTVLRDEPRELGTFALAPESKRFEAWDLKGGTVVPEPATALLMGAGLAALAVLRGLRGKSGLD